MALLGLGKYEYFASSDVYHIFHIPVNLIMHRKMVTCKMANVFLFSLHFSQINNVLVVSLDLDLQSKPWLISG